MGPPVLGYLERRLEGTRARSLLANLSPTSSEASDLTFDEELEHGELTLTEELTDVDTGAGSEHFKETISV